MNAELKTLDGSKYTLKVATRTFTNYIHPGNASVWPTLYVNMDASLNAFYVASPEVINIVTSKKIIPLQLNFSLLIGSNVIYQISSCYFNYMQWTPSITIVNNALAMPSLTKNSAYVKQNYYSSPNNYNYSIDYNNIVYIEKDFIQPNGALFPFNPFLAPAMVNSVTAFYNTNSAGVIPAGTIDSTISILYFEL